MPVRWPRKTTVAVHFLRLTQSRLISLARQELHLDIHLLGSYSALNGLSVAVPRVAAKRRGGGTQEGNDRKRGQEEDRLHCVTPCCPYNGYLLTEE
jgi:hypothetical protein